MFIAERRVDRNRNPFYNSKVASGETNEKGKRNTMSVSPRENKMGTMPVAKLVVTMSLPMILSMLVQALYNVVDSMYVSRLSEGALTAVSLCFPAQNLMIGVSTGIAVGVNALLSRALGADDRKRANQVAENGVFLALIGYILFLLFGLFGGRALLAAQTSVESIIQDGTDYLRVCCCLSFGLFGQIMFERLMQSTGRTKYTLYTQGTGAVINILLDPVFIFSPDEFFCGVFGMGVKGAAVATVIGQIVAFVLAVILNRLKNEDIRLRLRTFRPDGFLIGRIFGIGIPSVIMMAIGSFMTFSMNKILIAYTTGKETAATVFGVYFKLNSFVFMPIFGLNNGVIPIIAFNYGAKNRLRMMKAVKVALSIALGVMALGTLLFLVIPDRLLSIFNADAAMTAIGVPALRIIGSTFPIAGVCIVLGSVFQALGFSTYSMWVSMARQLFVLIPAAWALAAWGQSIGNDNLVWLSFVFAEAVSLIATLLLFRRMYGKVIRPLPEGSKVL